MKIKTIDVTAKEWFDKINGNSYFSARVIINYQMKNQKSFCLPFQYGYGDHYIDMAKEKLVEEKIIKTDKLTQLWGYVQDENIILRTIKHVDQLKRTVVDFGKD